MTVPVHASDRCRDRGQPDLQFVDGDGVAVPADVRQDRSRAARVGHGVAGQRRAAARPASRIAASMASASAGDA